jgi:hypothetical protein
MPSASSEAAGRVQKKLDAAQAFFTRGIEASLKAAQKMGLTHKPRTQIEATLLLNKQVHRVADAMQGLLGIQRSMVSLRF